MNSGKQAICRMSRAISVSLLCAGLVYLHQCGAKSACGQVQFDSEPINYSSPETSNRIVDLEKQLETGKVTLKYDESNGYLPDLLRILEIPTSSQMLVFSQTSFQLRKISPRRPRAVYFNDDTYIGWVQGGDVIEVSTVDPNKGAIFYTLDQAKSDAPQFIRDQGNCMACHSSSRTQSVPGHVVRSVYADRGGNPLYGAGTFTTDHTSPFEHRWGGWFVTGSHGEMRHMGNLFAKNRNTAEFDNPESGANRESLDDLFDTEPYLHATSDIVALMVLEHQTQMHNFLTLANYEARSAVHYDRLMNKTLERDENYRSESTERRINSAAEKVVKYMLFVDEFALQSPVVGVSDFAKEFSARGPTDSQGRSLRQFDLQTRLFKYPCSYLIYSAAFTELPAEMKQRIYQQLFDVLYERSENKEFAHLSSDDRTAIREILLQTHPEIAKAFQALSAAADQ